MIAGVVALVMGHQSFLHLELPVSIALHGNAVGVAAVITANQLCGGFARQFTGDLSVYVCKL